MPQIQDIMSRNPVTCYDSDIVFKAVEIMKRQNVGVVPVVDQNQVCKGIITDRDIVLEVIYNQNDPKTTLLRNIMTQNLVTCSPNEELDSVIELMRSRQVKRVLVVDQGGRCLGIVSEADLAQKVRDSGKVGEMSKGVYGSTR